MTGNSETKTVSSVLAVADEKLQIAFFGLEDMKVQARSSAGLQNAVVFGRMATFALQNLRGTCADFEDWYGPKMEEMRSDPLMKYFSDLRTKIEKTTEAYTAKGYEYNFNNHQLDAVFGPPPPGAYMRFVGDTHGRSGWRVRSKDGSISEDYVSLPESMARPFTILPTAPLEYQSMEATKSVEIYLDKLSGLLRQARGRFEGVPHLRVVK